MSENELINPIGGSPLSDDGRRRVFRAAFGKSAVPAIVHVTVNGVPAGETSRRFECHYQAALAAGPAATPAPLYIGPWDDGIALVLENRISRVLSSLVEAGPQPVGESLALARDAARALADFHRAGWLHRAIRPSHVGVAEDGGVLLIGLGSARRIQAKGPDAYELPPTAAAMGYVAPEQTGRLDRPMDWRTDLFSLAATLYALLSGRAPFTGKDPAAVLYDCLAAIPPALDSIRSDVSPFLAKVLERAMAKDPDRRYRTLSGFVADLELAMAHPEPAFDAEPGSRDSPEALLWAGLPETGGSLGLGDMARWIQESFPDTDIRRDSLTGTILAAGIVDVAGLKDFMLSLTRSGAAVYDASRGTWTISPDLAAEKNIVSTVESIVPGKIASVDDDTARYLECASCAGDDFDAYAVAAILHHRDPEGEPLKQAMEAGLVVPSRRGGSAYQFSHPAIRKRLYESLETIRRSAWHSAFAERYENSGRADLAVPHILADPLKPRRRDEMIKRAQVFHDAASAKATIDQEQSFLLSQRAKNMLGAAGWRDAYRLTVGVTERLAILAAALGKRDEFVTAAKELAAEARGSDYTSSREALIAGYSALGMSDLAVQTGLEALRHLGHPLPSHPSTAVALGSYAAARMLRRFGGDPMDPARKPMPEGRALETLKIVIATGTPAYIARPRLVPLLVALGLRLTARYGEYPGMAVIFAAMGFIEAGVFHSYRKGYRLGVLAENLAAKSAGAARYCQTRLIASSFVTHWMRPFRETMDALLDAARTGKALGDTEYSSLAYCAYLQAIILEGRGFQAVDAALPEIESSVRGMGQELPIIVLDASLCFIRAMRDGIGSSEGPLLRGESLAVWQDRLVERRQYAVACDIALYRALAAFAFGHLDEAKAAVSAIRPFRDSYSGQYPDTIFTLLEAILEAETRLDDAEGKPARGSSRLIRRAAGRFGQWAGLNPACFDSKRVLILAIGAYERGARDSSFDLFEKAAALARTDGNLLDEALIASEYARRLKRCGRKPAATFQSRNGYDALVRWGALGAAREMADGNPDLGSWVRASPGGGLAGGLRVVDAEALIEASSALAAELNPGRLVERLMNLSMMLTGARFGAVWLRHRSAWHARARGSYSPEMANRLSVPSRIEDIALSMRTMVGPAERGAGSEALVPLANRGKVIGVLQLVNDLTAEAFPPQRLGIVEVIAAQAAVAMENADLYEGLERKVAERTRELEEALKNVRRLRGLIPICSSCKKVRDDSGYWSQVEEYISARTEADFTHGLCPDCLNRYYDEMGIPPDARASESG